MLIGFLQQQPALPGLLPRQTWLLATDSLSTLLCGSGHGGPRGWATRNAALEGMHMQLLYHISCRLSSPYSLLPTSQALKPRRSGFWTRGFGSSSRLYNGAKAQLPLGTAEIYGLVIYPA